MLSLATYSRQGRRGALTRAQSSLGPVTAGSQSRTGAGAGARKDHTTMRRQLLAAFAVGTAGLLALTACGSSDSETPSGGGSSAAAVKGKVGVILPDSASSARWETNDRPLLKAAFDDAGIDSDIQNAGGDVAKFQSLADGMLSSGVKALLIVNLDSDSGAAVVKKATDAGVPVIDYDRLTLGGGSQYYVSFDNVAVGTAIGEGLVKCLSDAKKKPA